MSEANTNTNTNTNSIDFATSSGNLCHLTLHFLPGSSNISFALAWVNEVSDSDLEEARKLTNLIVRNLTGAEPVEVANQKCANPEEMAKRIDEHLLSGFQHRNTTLN